MFDHLVINLFAEKVNDSRLAYRRVSDVRDDVLRKELREFSDKFDSTRYNVPGSEVASSQIDLAWHL
jgi:hypothetical protein